tara:strand:+ start:391 stop:651 length:261 start_codon:yes stop_codon:yes gene_type:complete
MAKLFYVTQLELEAERDKLSNDFDATKKNIISLENDIKKLTNNLNALHGAIQQMNKMIETAAQHGRNDDWVEDFYKKHLKEKKKKK